MSAPWWALAFALVALWANTLIIAADALMRRRWIRRQRPLRTWDGHREGPAVIAGTIEGSGPLARHTVEQRGRLTSAGRVVWHDRAYRSQLFGGVIRTAHGPVTLALPAAPERTEVWPDRPQQLQRAAEDAEQRAQQDHVAKEAKRAKGIVREVVSELATGDTVHALGRVVQDGDGFRLDPLDEGPLVVAASDPAGWSRRAQTELAAFAGAAVLMCAALTWGAAAPPAFGLRSTLFGAGCLLFFLLVQPAGVWLRARTLEPAYRPLEGSFTPGSSPR